jgi:hypothetical protein
MSAVLLSLHPFSSLLTFVIHPIATYPYAERRFKATLFSVSRSEHAQRASVAELQGGLLDKA